MDSERLARLVHVRSIIRDVKKVELAMASVEVDRARAQLDMARHGASEAESALHQVADLHVGDLELRARQLSDAARALQRASDFVRDREMAHGERQASFHVAEREVRTVQIATSNARRRELRVLNQREQQATDERASRMMWRGA